MDLFRAGFLGQNRGGDSDSEEEMRLLDADELEDSDEGEINEDIAVSDNGGGEEGQQNDSSSRSETEQASRSTSSKGDKRGKVEFDISLPARHLYLGDLEEDGPANMEDDEATPTMPLLCIPSRVLFPGETLPMHIYNPHVIPVLRDVSTRNKAVAVCTDLRVRHNDNSQQQVRPIQQELAEIGTTAELVAFREQDESPYSYGPCIVVKFLGRQRFRMLELHRKSNGLMDCRVRILPEQYIPPLPPHLTSCPAHILASCCAVQLRARREDCTRSTLSQLACCRTLLQRPCLNGSLTQVPPWVYSFYDTDRLREELLMERELKTFKSDDSMTAHLPTDVSSLSYWLARRLPVDESSKLVLLSMDCPTLRLIKGMQMLKEFTELRCIQCRAIITHKCHMFSMSVEGPLAAYVNPGGFVHDTLTVMEAKGLKKQGLSSIEHSWFPGYKWTILICQTCSHHKGWCFEATKKKLVPHKFYGLTRLGLVLTSPLQSNSEVPTL